MGAVCLVAGDGRTGGGPAFEERSCAAVPPFTPPSPDLKGRLADVFGAEATSSDNVAKASSSFSPDPHEAQNFMYRDTIVSKYVSCVLASDSRVSPLEGRPYASRASIGEVRRRLHAPEGPRLTAGRLVVAIVQDHELIERIPCACISITTMSCERESGNTWVRGVGHVYSLTSLDKAGNCNRDPSRLANNKLPVLPSDITPGTRLLFSQHLFRYIFPVIFIISDNEQTEAE